MNIKYGDRFELGGGLIAKVTEMFSVGLNYHTLNDAGDCIASQKYATKSDFQRLIEGLENE